MDGLIVIGGPTASGKSTLALRLAEALDGTIVNADSMQLYRDLRIVTARPGAADLGRAPHRLYGVLAASSPCSVGRWLTLAGPAIGAATATGRLAIVVGGTGLYLHALLHGLAPVPDVPAAVRAGIRARYGRLDDHARHAALERRDPEMAARLQPSDRQRTLRALEVHAATGRSLIEWQGDPPQRVDLPARRLGLLVAPARPALRGRIRQRLGAMVEAGALDELAGLRARRLDPTLPLMKALAVRELLAHLAGELDLAEALERATIATRQYAKRQSTWFRHRLPELQTLSGFGDRPADMPDPEAIRRSLLTGVPLPHSVRPARRPCADNR